MIEQEWEQSTKLLQLLWFLQGKASNRKLRLFALACAEAVQHLMQDTRSRDAVDAAQRYTQGTLSAEDMAGAHAAAGRAYATLDSAELRTNWAASVAAHVCAPDGDEIANAVFYVAQHAALAEVQFAVFGVNIGPDDEALESAADEIRSMVEGRQCQYLRDIFGNPFRPVVFDAARRTPAVMAVAQTIYKERRFQDMPVLADALEEAGFINAHFLNHCRRPGLHVPGCHVVDDVLGLS